MEEKDLESPETPEEEAATPPKPVPDLPEDGDLDDFNEEPVDDDDFGELDEAQEELEDPNDLSGIEKEFTDED